MVLASIPICVLLMSLDVGTKLKADMFLVVQGLPGKEVTWRESIDMLPG
jgi:hypothetical protein